MSRVLVHDGVRTDIDAQLARKAERKRARARRINAEKHDSRVMLKIKLKSLAAEAKMIRREELLRIGGWLRTSLRAHRIGTVRWHARTTHLAYGAPARARAKANGIEVLRMGRQAQAGRSDRMGRRAVDPQGRA